MNLILVRHGQSTNNLPEDERDGFHGCEHELTPLGEQQATALTKWLRADTRLSPAKTTYARTPSGGSLLNPFDLSHAQLLTSPMLRAIQTAEILRRHLALHCEISVDLHEWGGPSERQQTNPSKVIRGHTRTEFQSRFPAIAPSLAVTEEGWWNRSSRETPDECWRRAETLVNLIVRRGQQVSTIMVTHLWLANVVRRLLGGGKNSFGWWEREWSELNHTGWCAWDLGKMPSDPMVWNCVEHLSSQYLTS